MEVKGRVGGVGRRSEEGWEVFDVERGQEYGKWLEKKKGKENKWVFLSGPASFFS